MHFDFALLLVILTLFTGVVWLVDALFFARKRGEAKKEPLVVEYSRSFFPVIVLVLLVRSFLGEPFRIPSTSMMPNLLVGDLILVNRFAYGLRWPVLNTKIVETGDPERGDVVVFRYPVKPEQNYIKRVVGLPGDQIAVRNGFLSINGEPVPVELNGVYQPPDDHISPGPHVLGTERLPGAEHQILRNVQMQGRRHPLDGQWVVPEGHYFVMGDNRDHSADSRVWDFVPDENLVGKAQLIWMRLSTQHWDRIGQTIK